MNNIDLSSNLISISSLSNKSKAYFSVDNKNDIDGLASLISACDEVVSTTNVTVHLAGALGADVSVLLPFVPRWIWGKPNSPSTWYRSVKPYRQSAAGNWDNVLRLLRNVSL